MALDEDTQKLKDMELSEGQTKIYNFTFIGTIETYEDLLDKEYQDQFDTFRLGFIVSNIKYKY